jgi:hypothetical protein
MEEEIRPLIFDPEHYVEDAIVEESQIIQQFINKIVLANRDAHVWQIQGIVDTPSGERQPDLFFNDIWVEQYQSGDDSYYGRIWYPLPCGTKWVQTWYNM